MADERHEALLELGIVLPNLGADEIRVLALIGTRLAMGASQYGLLDLKNDLRNWRRERIEELADAQVYAACEELKTKPEVSNG